MFSLILLLSNSCSKNSSIAPDNGVPTGGDSTIVVTPVQYGTPYQQVPDPSDVVLYQVNFKAFSPTGDFNGVIARLDSIHALGANVLYLMPIYPQGLLKSVGSPYCVKDYTAVNSSFGSLTQLRNLVDAAHAKNMAVIFDWVADHTSWDNAWIANKAWYLQDGSGNIISPPNTNWTDVAALNFNNNDMRQQMITAMKYWVYTANIDGYRCDAADYVPYDFWQQAIDSLNKISSHKLLLFAEGTKTTNFLAGFELRYGMGFYSLMKDQIFGQGKSVKGLDSLNAAEFVGATTQNQQVVRYLSNHDVDLSDGTPLDLFGGKNGSLAAFVVAAYLKGVPMLYNGQEVGCPIKLDYFGTGTHIDWTINPDLTAAYKQIIGFRNSSDAIRNGTLSTFNSDDVCAFTKTIGSQQVFVLVNLRAKAVSYSVPMSLNNSSWTNALTKEKVNISNSVSMDPYQYLILTSL